MARTSSRSARWSDASTATRRCSFAMCGVNARSMNSRPATVRPTTRARPPASSGVRHAPHRSRSTESSRGGRFARCDDDLLRRVHREREMARRPGRPVDDGLAARRRRPRRRAVRRDRRGGTATSRRPRAGGLRPPHGRVDGDRLRDVVLRPGTPRRGRRRPHRAPQPRHRGGLGTALAAETLSGLQLTGMVLVLVGILLGQPRVVRAFAWIPRRGRSEPVHVAR